MSRPLLNFALHYGKLGCALLEPSCTPKGARQMRRILAGGHDERLWASAGAVIAQTAPPADP